jgi:hypothetical protein
MNAGLAAKRWWIFSAAGCLVPAALGISGMVHAQGVAATVQAGASTQKATRRATGPILRPELRLSRELGSTQWGEKAHSDSLPELPAEASANQSSSIPSGRIPLPAGDLNRTGIVPASRLRVEDGRLILEADLTGKEGER